MQKKKKLIIIRFSFILQNNKYIYIYFLMIVKQSTGKHQLRNKMLYKMEITTIVKKEILQLIEK